MTKRFVIQKIPAATDWQGKAYPAHFQLIVYCSRGLGWDGGEFATREDAVKALAA